MVSREKSSGYMSQVLSTNGNFGELTYNLIELVNRLMNI